MPPKKTGSSMSVTPRRRGQRKAALRRKTHLHNLPPELISEIFLSYHWTTQAPIVLLLVCRHWHDIALSISALWSTILWSTTLFGTRDKYQDLPSIERTMYWPPHCLSWGQFESAVCRAGGAKLSIAADMEIFDNSADTNIEVRSWLPTRCRSLRLNLRSGPMDNIVNSFHQMIGLEELSLTVPNWHIRDIGRILENLETGSPRLVGLKITGDFPNELVNRHTMLGRLHKLSISGIIYLMQEPVHARMISHLITLEELTWPFDCSSELQLVSEKLRSLTIEHCQTFRAMPFTRLTSLTLKCARLAVRDEEVVELPCLKDLTFFGYWQRFILLRAPLLIDLHFECWDLGNKRDLTQSPETRPRSLTIHNITNEVEENNLIQLLSGIWSELEEIHWVYLQGQSMYLGRKLTIALSGTKHNEPLCPRLRHLTMKTDDPLCLDSFMTDRVELRLREIARERQRCGKGLHSIRWRWDTSIYAPSFFTGLKDPVEEGFSIL